MFLSLKRSSPLSSSMSRLPNRHFFQTQSINEINYFRRKKSDTSTWNWLCEASRNGDWRMDKTIGRSVGRSNLSTCDLYLFAVAQSGKKEHFGINNLKLLSSLSFDQFFPFFTLLRLKSRVGPIQQRSFDSFFYWILQFRRILSKSQLKIAPPLCSFHRRWNFLVVLAQCLKLPTLRFNLKIDNKKSFNRHQNQVYLQKLMKCQAGRLGPRDLVV
jgi:hypothetical protein